MPIGPAPDWQDVTWMVGNYGGTPTLIAVDAAGRMYAVLYGSVTIGAPVDVNQLDSVREMQGADGVILHTIAVDSKGRIIALIKGVYSGELKNVAVDEQGRMIMIPTDPADVWGNAISMGNAELAARLGRVIRKDNRGQSLLVEDFEHGFSHVQLNYVGTGGSWSLTSDESLFGRYALKLIGGSDSLRYALATWKLGYSPLTKIGIEAGLRLGSVAEFSGVRIIVYTGATAYTGAVGFDDVNNKLVYLNSGGTYSDLATGLYFDVAAHLFHPMKLVIDPSAGKYVRFLYHNQEVDMSTISLYSPDSNTPPEIDGQVQIISTSGDNDWLLVGYAVITQNEPT